MKIADAPFALRVTRRTDGLAGIVYRRGYRAEGGQGASGRLQRLSGISPLAFTAGAGLLRAAAHGSAGPGAVKPALQPGPWLPLDADWGARVACYALITDGLRDPDRLSLAAGHLRRADGTEAAWWLGQMTGPAGMRAIRALRILIEAVQ